MDAGEKRQADAAPGAHYVLVCPLCGGRYEDSTESFLLSCPEKHPPALLRAEYREKRFLPRPENSGAFRFSDWLPIRRTLPGAAGPVAWHSEKLGRRLGLSNLFIIFNGFWPEKGAYMETCTFKELEAQAVCGRVLDRWHSSLVVSSAGNTARAFHDACNRYAVRAVIVVPSRSMPLLWSTRPAGPSVRLAVLDGGADYTDAIELGNGIAGAEGFYPEGGARNAARRDGMGTAVLAAVEASGVMPDHYVQAVGSGTGAIAAWEMSLRLAQDARYGGHTMRLHLAQNAPFTPMTDAWQAGSRTLAPMADGRERVGKVRAQVLANRTPPYSIAGGLYDALHDTGGFMYRVTNADAEEAGRLFDECEGSDIDPAAEVALDSLRQAVAQGRIGPRDVVALNITGGGLRRLARERSTEALSAHATFTLEGMHAGERARGLAALREGLL
jgi:cysteate synthase